MNSYKARLWTALTAAAIFALVVPAPSSAETGSFVDGLKAYESRNYPEAVKSFKAALTEVPAVGDYVLLYTARAYHKMSDSKNTAGVLGTLLRDHPDSPLKKKALELQIKSARAMDEDKAMRLLESFVNVYPGSCDERYLLGQMYRKRAKKTLAKAQFKILYALPCAISKKAARELAPSDLAASDHLMRARNLFEVYGFREAERTLRKALKKKVTGEPREELLRALGKSLFRQKRYTEAAKTYARAHDPYSAARAHYRSGNEGPFLKTLGRLIKMHDKRAAGLLLAHAADKRRDGDTGEALKILYEVREKYPRKSAQAVWMLGWTHYMDHNYTVAIQEFTRLYDVIRDTRSLYWMARATEKSGLDASPLYTKLRGADDFYGELARRKSSGLKASRKDTVVPISRKDSVFIPELKRVDILNDAGLREEAVNELRHLARSADNPYVLTTLAYRLHDLGAYKRAIGVLWRVPGKMRPEELMYPSAYWPHVKAVAGDFGIDPLLLLSVMREESRFDRKAYSVAGAMGLMQLMPQTAKRLARSLKVDIRNKDDIYDVGTNIRLGSYYLSRLIKEFGSQFPALAAYNAGENNVRRWLKRGRYESFDEFVEDIPYPETKKYIKRIMATYYHYSLPGRPN